MDHLIVKEALPDFYSNYHLKHDGGINDPEVKIELLKGISLFIPNFKARKKVVLKHDIHHLVTGYSAVMKGETEISAWELSTGCTQNWFAFTINTYGMMMGIPFNLWRIWLAWRRGKLTKNLYHDSYKDQDLLDHSVTSLKKELGLLEDGKPRESSFASLLSFVCFVAFGTGFSLASLVLFPLVLIYSLYIFIRNLWQKR